MDLLTLVLVLVICLPLVIAARIYFAKTPIPTFTLLAGSGLVVACTIFLLLVRDMWHTGGIWWDEGVGRLVTLYVENLVFVVINFIILVLLLFRWKRDKGNGIIERGT